MEQELKPGRIAGSIVAPASKSHMQRLVACILLQEADCLLTNASRSEDCLAVLEVFRQLGGKAVWQDNHVQLNAPKRTNWMEADKQFSISFGESGLASRMFTPILASSAAHFSLKASGSLVSRPMQPLLDLLAQWQVKVETNDIFLPKSINGAAQLCHTIMDGSSSSQYLTGTLLAASASAQPITLEASNLKSRPYVQLTLDTLAQTGMNVPLWTADDHFVFSPAQAKPCKPTIAVEGDWSGAAFLLVAAAVAGAALVQGLSAFSSQADKAVLQALQEASVAMSIRETEVEIYPSPHLRAFHFNATDCPDLFPPLAALACFCKGKSVIEGVSRLTHKESNRALTIQAQLGRLGQPVVLQDDLMIIEGGQRITPQQVSSCHDHRIAMMLAVVALRSPFSIELTDAEAIQKSYPDFYADLAKLYA